MKNLIKSRRGIAIEMAIGAMFIMMALSIVLISISGMQTRHMKNDRNDFHEKIEVYEITDYILKNQKIDQPVEQIGTNSEYEVDVKKDNSINTDSTSVYVYTIKTSGGEVILTLEIATVTKDGKTTNIITSWRD